MAITNHYKGQDLAEAQRLMTSERRDASRTADEVVFHLPAGVPDHVVRTVMENARTLKFKSQGFETE
jgi:hypothetical protein